MIRITLIIFTWLLFVFSAAAQEATLRRIKIGAILPLTGDFAAVGTAIRQGIELCTSKAHHVDISVIFEDDKSINRLQAVRAVKKLVNQDQVSVVFNAYLPTVPSIESITRQARVPCVVIWDSSRMLKKFHGDILGFGFSTELAGEDMAQFARDKLGRKSAAVISLVDDWSEIISSSFSEKFTESSGKVLMRERVTPETTDFRTLISKAKSAGADVLYLPLSGSGLHSAIKQARSLQFKGDILTGDAFGEADMQQLGSSAEGVYVSQIWFDNPSFRREYSERFGSIHSNGTNLGYAALGCDAVKLIDELSGRIISRGGEPSSSNLQKGFTGFSFKGVLGETTIADDNATNRREPILQVKDGKFTLVAGQ